MIFFIINFILINTVIESTKLDIPIRLMTYNVMRGRFNCYEEQLKSNADFRRATNIQTFHDRADFVRTNLATIANYIRQYEPDIIAIQEVQESPSSTSTNNEISTATYLSQQLDMTFTFSPTLFDNEVQMQYGTAILLNHHKYRLISVEILSLPPGLEPRNSPCLTIQSRSTNITFRACSIHFDHHTTDNTIRLQQSNTIINWLTKGQYYPTILLGDFNANQTSPTLTNLYKYFFDDNSSDSSRPTWSECGEILKDKIDYILLDRQSQWTIKQFLHGLNMKKLYSSIDLTMLSDHVPLFADTVLSIQSNK
jgi:endonuclease/exonuclease/phosphatase family metal-dependent hydrolase